MLYLFFYSHDIFYLSDVLKVSEDVIYSDKKTTPNIKIILAVIIKAENRTQKQSGEIKEQKLL
ncbi:hypothetical protein ACNKHW_25935 [Shigella flexneri]